VSSRREIDTSEASAFKSLVDFRGGYFGWLVVPVIQPSTSVGIPMYEVKIHLLKFMKFVKFVKVKLTPGRGTPVLKALGLSLLRLEVMHLEKEYDTMSRVAS
jgi:hypothetical protein